MSGYKKIKRSGSFYIKRQSGPRRFYNERKYQSPASLHLTSANSPKCFKLQVREKGSSFFTSSGSGVLTQGFYVNDPSVCTEWTNLQPLFDMYKVLSCTIRFFPAYNENYTGQSPYAPFYTYYDPDSSGAVGSVDAAMGYDNMRAMNLFKPNKYKVKVVTQTDNSVNNAGMALSYVPGWGNALDTVSASYYHKGFIGWYADGVPASTNFGDLLLEFIVMFFTRH